MKKILVIGSSNIDHVSQVSHMPEEGETIISHSYQRSFGGKGANQAYACGKLGGTIQFLSAVGNDDTGLQMIRHLQTVYVNCDEVLRSAEAPTGMAFINVDADGNNSIVVVPGANEKCTSDYISLCLNVMENSDIVMLQLEIPHEAAWYAIRKAHEMGKVVILDPAPAPEHGVPEEIYRYITCLTPNEVELQMLTGMPTDTIEEIDAAADVLKKKGVRNVVVTLGDRGAYLKKEKYSALLPPFAVKPVDTTAAGDTFNAAMAVFFAETDEIDKDTIIYANAAAALASTRKGAQTSVPSREEVDSLMKNHRGKDE